MSAMSLTARERSGDSYFKCEFPGAEGATAPETLRQKDRAFVDSDTLESASPIRARPPKV
jgi:hypothetical protein